jgi:hypothetical protein
MVALVSRDLVGQYDSIVLENSTVRAVIIPALGGRVWELEDRVRRRQWIWHREDVPLKECPLGSVYDDVWAGGWEELFPNDAPGVFEGRELPDHGEWWTMPWSAVDTSSGSSASVRLSATSSVIKASCAKEFFLASDAETLLVRYRIRSNESRPFHFLFKQHLPIALTPDCRLLLPGGRVQVVDPSFSTMVPGGVPFDWPLAGKADSAIDMRVVPPLSSKAREFLYVKDLPQPWCGVEDVHTGASIRLAFNFRELPYAWLFLSYGGWRNLYTAVLEPCSNLPKDLPEAVRLGQSARLEPGQEFTTTVAARLTGLAETRS